MSGLGEHLTPDVLLALPDRAREALLQALEAELARDPDAPDPPPLKMLTASDALRPRPPIFWLLDGLLAPGAISLWYGDGGSKKTYAMLDLAVCVATGAEWLGMQTRRCPVLFIDEESGEDRFSRRLGEVLRGHEAGEATPIFGVCLRGFNLREPADLGLLDWAIRQVNAGLVVVDALVDVLGGADENSAGETQPIFQNLRGIADRHRCHIALIHHANKSGGYRGSTVFRGAVDLLVSVTSKPHEALITFEPEKARDGDPKAWAARATWFGDMFWLAPAEVDAASSVGKAERYVLRYLQEHGGEADLAEIVAHADTCSEAAARRAVYSLADRGKIRRIDSGGKGTRARYSLINSAHTPVDGKVGGK